ncbi:hypothetical protein, partial [Actinomyces trachealis]|uniref:hypothetical protein n=1 Tax=Actinomyces trachealis TaxID=2763540 RepID=UPI00189299A9
MSRSTRLGTRRSGLKALLALSALCLAVVPVIGSAPAAAGPTAGPRLLAPQRGANLSCVGGDYYTLDGEGYVYKVPSTDGEPESHGASNNDVFRFRREGSKSEFNGLAIGSDGAVAWAINRADSSGLVGIYKWEASTGTTRRLTLAELPNGTYGKVRIGSLVAGGVNPKDPNGTYYFGGFLEGNDGNTYFAAYKYVEGRIDLAGYVYVLNGYEGGKGNGDLVFSASGDMFILWNNGDGSTRVVPVRSEDLDAANAGVIPNGDISTLKTGEGKYNGLAFDPDGRLLIQYTRGGKSYNYSIDPDDGERLSDKVSIGISGGSDLASCAAPPTLYVQKEVVGRNKPNDQFTISVEGKGGKPRASETTSGRETGIQASIGVFILFKPRTYTIKEVGAGGTNLAGYNTTLSCVDESTDEELPIERVTDTEYTFTQKDGSNHDAICTLRNEPKPKTGSVTWKKVDGSGGALAGSGWQIIPDAVGQAMIEVTDN